MRATQIVGSFLLWSLFHIVRGDLICGNVDFLCAERGCVSRTWYCDNDNDCSDRSDEYYCNIGDDIQCPSGWYRCSDNTRCFPSYWLCNGFADCRDGSDEKDCERDQSKIPGIAATKEEDVAMKVKNDSKDPILAAAKERLISWFKQRRKSGSTIEKWGSQLHRIAVALYLADESIFSPGNSTGQEISYELTIQLLRCLSKDKKMSSQKLALYIHAMMVACMDPKDFYGENLVSELRRRTEASGNYTNPFQILVLCNAGDTMTSKDVERVTAAYYSQHRPFWTDTQALASLALACLSSRPNLVIDERILKDMLQELKRRQFRNGTVDNVRTTALVVQALQTHDSFKKDFDLNSAVLTIMDSIKSNVSLLNAYYALPVLSNTTLLNVSSSHCRSAPQTGPVDLKLRPNQEIILWYKPGPWNPQLRAAESKKSV